MLYDIVNSDDEVLYIKSDGSLDYGMELVSHSCSLEYYRQGMNWQKLMRKAAELGYRSHNTKTCGLHVHILEEHSLVKATRNRMSYQQNNIFL
ncbi:amidoligase family protein [Porcipelethomonas ammoniilytica]|uniref:hypothetical protein n=1 Tax=Porcipelethomonas ammoniilytica TaxID=2981722 RepID=UPI00082200EE|nr:hypothetical protein [Porcipelethomonas ammoniilytica]MCU6720217.1 amidoligase family protein [Porcipelethomonas ammoniilytica]SCJ05765.1 Uncharacterised protein [uncultured Ruminococcus sp.]